MTSQPRSFLRQVFGLSGWGAFICLILLVIGLAGAWGSSERAARLDREADTTTATIARLFEKPYRPGQTNRGDRYRVTYSFTVGSETHLGTQSVSGVFFRSLSMGDTVPVRYWTRDPGLSEIEPGDAARDSWIALAISLVAAIGAVSLGWRAYRNATEAAWMARHGLRHSAEVVDHARTSVKINGVSLWRAEWRTPDGVTGTSARRRKSALPPIGALVPVLLDPEGHRPGRLETDICA